MTKIQSEHERISVLESALPNLSMKLEQISNAIVRQPRLTFPITYSGSLGGLGALSTIAAMNPLPGLWARVDVGFPIEPGDFETTATRAGFLAVFGQLMIGAALQKIAGATAIPQDDDAKRTVIGGLISDVEACLAAGKEALKLAAGAAAAGKKFGDALPSIEAAVTSFLQAEQMLAAARSQWLGNLDDAWFNQRKAEVQNAANKVKEDLGSVKAALGKIT